MIKLPQKKILHFNEGKRYRINQQTYYEKTDVKMYVNKTFGKWECSRGALLQETAEPI